MPKGKDIYEDLSKKYAERKEARKKRAELKLKDKDGNPVKPATINNFEVNKPLNARSLNFIQGPVKRRKISPTEGKPVVNASTDVKKLIHKPKPVVKSPLDNPTAGHIKEETAPKTKKPRGRPKSSKKTPRKKRNEKTQPRRKTDS